MNAIPPERAYDSSNPHGEVQKLTVSLSEMRDILRRAGWQERTIELMGVPSGPVHCGSLELNLR